MGVVVNWGCLANEGARIPPLNLLQRSGPRQKQLSLCGRFIGTYTHTDTHAFDFSFISISPPRIPPASAARLLLKQSPSQNSRGVLFLFISGHSFANNSVLVSAVVIPRCRVNRHGHPLHRHHSKYIPSTHEQSIISARQADFF